jgi:DNA-binding transcriptional MerR regulator/methylmalonyl-CoA mutase cobalamin-binding subunit
VPKNTLIAWERRYGIVSPVRTESGYRVYSDRDLAVLRRVQSLLDQGYKVGEACQIVLDEPAPAPAGAARPAPSDIVALTAVKDEVLTHLLAFDRAEADRAAVRLLVVPVEVVIDAVFFPLLREVGRAWEEGRVSVVQEHFVSAWCRERLLVMLNGLQAVGAPGPEVTCATPAGERHELGLLALALRLALRGFRVVYLGADVPTDELVAHVNARRPMALCLSVVHVGAPGELRARLRDLRARIDARVRIAVGGRATEEPGLEVEGITLAGHGLPAWLAVGTRA